MKKWLIALIVLGACSSSPVMTIDDYTEVDIGTTAQVLEKKYGKPVKITTTTNGVTTYEYVERFMMGSQLTEMRRYYFQIKDGKVVGKYIKTLELPPYQDIYTDDPFPEQVH